jgi:hypothetical protein
MAIPVTAAHRLTQVENQRNSRDKKNTESPPANWEETQCSFYFINLTLDNTFNHIIKSPNNVEFLFAQDIL